MKTFGLLFIVFAFACKQPAKNITAKTNTSDSMQPAFDFIWDAPKVTKDDLPQLLGSIHDSLCFEVTDLYPPVDSIGFADELILDDSMANKGFTRVSQGRGNWEYGPQLVSLQMQNDSFYCRIDKLYYSDTVNRNKLNVTERIAFLKRPTPAN